MFRKRIEQKKFLFITTNNSIVLALRWSVKYYLLRIPRYSGKVVEKTKMKDFRINPEFRICYVGQFLHRILVFEKYLK